MLADLMGAKLSVEENNTRRCVQDDAHKSLTSLEIHCINITPSLEALASSLESVTSQQRTSHDRVSAKSQILNPQWALEYKQTGRKSKSKNLHQKANDGNQQRKRK